MYKDLKIGMAIGFLLVVTIAAFLACTVSLESNNISDTEAVGVKNAQQPQLFSETLKSDGKHQQVYIIQKSQTIWEVSRICYGTPNRWSDILEANNITRPEKIKPGTRLIIP